MINESLLEIRQYRDDGYQPLIDYGAWRVAILRYHPELAPVSIRTMQRHDETDEVFVLLAGRCILFIGEGEETVHQVHAVDMQPLKCYNIKKSVWHTHTLSRDATVLIIENQDTSDANSPLCELAPEQLSDILQYTEQLW